MKINKWTIGLAVLLLAGMTAQAQISITNVTSLSAATNIAVIPFATYRTDTKEFGYGAAVLYRVSPYFWTGVRAQSLGHNTTTAGVQAQLQATVTWNNISITPFAEASTGLGSSSLYASAGPGAEVNIHTWKLGGHALNLGVIADYEHVVNGSQNFNEINAGPFIRFNF